MESSRVKGTNDDLASMSAQLNWRGTTPFGEISGIFPFASATDFETHLVNFSVGRLERGGTEFRQFSRRDVTRGFSTSETSAYDSWAAGSSLPDPVVSRFHACTYPIPTSYPLFSEPGHRSPLDRPRDFAQPCTVFSSIATASTSGKCFFNYIASIETSLKRKIGTEGIGIDGDELKDLMDDLWALHDNFDDGGNGSRLDGEDPNFLGEDE